MAVFPIRTYPDPVLRTPAAPVGRIDDDIRRLVADMLETMYQAPGVGLAAPQIGVALRVVVFDIGDGPHHLINPVLLETSGSWSFDEGCLSVPGRYWTVKRPGFARARGLNLKGEEIEYAGEELLGRVLQHEIDHVGGTLILERLPRRARKQALKEIREEEMAQEEGR
ncbi:MAG: peptide deformylase [Acidimicrobiia bacterium]|nr:peptide deformylase [Acidimicrobiia bacterium]